MGLMGFGLAAKEFYDEEREAKRKEKARQTAFERQKELIDYRTGIAATQKAAAEQRQERRDVDAFLTANGLEDTPENRRLALSAVRSYGLKDANVMAAEGTLTINPGGVVSTSTDDVVDSLIATESRGRLNAFRVNEDGREFGGRLQFGAARLTDFARDTGISYTPAQVAQLPENKQREIEDWHFKDINRRLSEQGLDQYVGTNINGVEVTRSGMVAAAHIGGFNGMKRWVESGGRYNPSDELGTSIGKYMRIHGGKKVPGYETPDGFQLSDTETEPGQSVLRFSLSDTEPDQQMNDLGFGASTQFDMGEEEAPVRVQRREASLSLNTGSKYDPADLAAMPVKELQRLRDLTTDPAEQALLDKAIDSAVRVDSQSDLYDPAKLAALPVTELQRLRELTTDPKNRKLLDKAIDAAEQFSADEEDWRDISTVREGNWRSIAAKAEEAGDTDYAERVRALGEQFEEGGYSLSDQTYVITYQDENGQTRRVTAPVDENSGQFVDFSTGNVIGRDRLVGNPIPSQDISGFTKEYARISGRVEPFQERRGALLDTMRSAQSLENLVRQNDNILTSIGGGGTRLINSLRQEFDALNELVSSGATGQEIDAEINRIAQENAGVLGEISDQAQLATLFNAEVLRFAFNYAKTGLGQEGVGLSNKDFDNALKIVSAGSSYDTFSKNLRSRVAEGISAVENNRLELNEDPAVRAVLEMPNAESWTSDLLNSSTEQFVQSRGLGEMYQWSQEEPEPVQQAQNDTATDPEPQQDTTGTLLEKYNAGQPIVVTPELAERYPAMQEFIGKTIRRRQEAQ